MKFTKRFTVQLVAGVFMVSGLVIAIAWPIEFDLLIPKDATNIEKFDFSDDRKLQINFNVKRRYPRFALVREQYAKLQKNGWTECKTKQDEWFNFFDASDRAISDKRCRYSYSKNFIRGSDLIYVIQRRYSKHKGVKACPAAPDNNEIEVTILYKKYDTQKQLRSALSVMEIFCDSRQQKYLGSE